MARDCHANTGEAPPFPSPGGQLDLISVVWRRHTVMGPPILFSDGPACASCQQPAASPASPEVSSDASEALESLHTFLKCDHLSGGADDTEWPEGRGTCPTETGIKVARMHGGARLSCVATEWALFLHLCGTSQTIKIKAILVQLWLCVYSVSELNFRT